MENMVTWMYIKTIKTYFLITQKLLITYTHLKNTYSLLYNAYKFSSACNLQNFNNPIVLWYYEQLIRNKIHKKIIFLTR